MFPGDSMFSIVPIFFFIIFALIIGTIILNLVKGAKQWNYNNNQPKLSVPALVMDKRIDVSHHHHHNNDNNMASHTSSTTYYITFQFDSGDRLELSVDGGEYGLITQGDKGILSFQGTRYLGFKRQVTTEF